MLNMLNGSDYDSLCGHLITQFQNARTTPGQKECMTASLFPATNTRGKPLNKHKYKGYTTPYNESPFLGALLVTMSTTTNRDTLQYELKGVRHDRT